MKSEDMILKAAIVHILDSSVGIPVLSDQSMEVGPDFSDFLKVTMSSTVHLQKDPRSKSCCKTAPRTISSRRANSSPSASTTS
mgnify:CR=1 FL=1